MPCVLKLELSPLRLPTLHSGSSPVYAASMVIYIHTSAQCSPTSVGFTQARPSGHLLSPKFIYINIIFPLKEGHLTNQDDCFGPKGVCIGEVPLYLVQNVS